MSNGRKDNVQMAEDLEAPMDDIRMANRYVLKVVCINLVLPFIMVFWGQNFASIGMYILLTVICFIMAQKGEIKIPIHRISYKKMLLCIGITITAYPMAEVLHILSSALSGDTASVIDVSQPLWLLVLSVAVFPAIGEEVAFRGLIQGAYMKESLFYSIFFSSLPFALMHCSVSAILYAFLYGCLFAIVRIFTGNIIYSICMHFLFNLINIGTLNTAGIDIGIEWMIGAAVLGSLLCGLMIMELSRSSTIHLTGQEKPIKKFIDKEGVIACSICLFMTVVL